VVKVVYCTPVVGKRASKLTWFPAGVSAMGKVSKALWLMIWSFDEPNQSPPVSIPVATETVVASGLAWEGYSGVCSLVVLLNQW